jgi:hypothetical protein
VKLARRTDDGSARVVPRDPQALKTISRTLARSLAFTFNCASAAAVAAGGGAGGSAAVRRRCERAALFEKMQQHMMRGTASHYTIVFLKLYQISLLRFISGFVPAKEKRYSH